MFAMVENRGVADVRSFTKLGLSSARGQSDKIGQFGSGAKHGVLTLIRAGLNPYIYCGKTKMEFFSQPNTMGETTYNDMFVKIGNAKPIELSYCLEFGELDWNSVDMGLREIVSNAIDNSEDGKFNVTIVDKPRAKDGFTRVFVPLDSSVQKFLNSISERFLHFQHSENKKVLNKTEKGRAKIYRKGVFVREVDEWNDDSLFDYNFGNELEIDECRNANDWDCKKQIGNVLSTDENMLRHMFLRFINGITSPALEDGISEYHLKSNSNWEKVWNEVANDNVVIVSSQQLNISEFLIKKGLKPCVIPASWYARMSTLSGIRKGIDCLSKLENKGCQLIEPSETAISILNYVWDWLVNLELTNGKSKPKIQCFSKVIENGDATLFGYCENDTIFINIDFQENKQTYLEEIAHYVTEACDGTREFQEFAFQIATRMGELIF